MIRNDDEYQVVREQLTRAETALESLRREVFPQNPRMYRMMSESYVDTILDLRGQVDSYLEISHVPENADLVISLQGSGVGLGRTSAALVTRFVDTFRKGLQSVVEIVESVDRPPTARRRERWIEEICDLPFVGVVPGSVKILLGEPNSQGLFKDEEKKSFSDAMDLLFQGLEWADTTRASSGDERFEGLPEETKQSLLALLTRLLPPRSGDVEQITFGRRQSTETSSSEISTSVLTRRSRERIREKVEQLTHDLKVVELEGLIRGVDLDNQTFTLRERPDQQPDLTCEYGKELEDSVKEYLDSRVTVAGTLETSRKTKHSKLSVDRIEIAPIEDNE